MWGASCTSTTSRRSVPRGAARNPKSCWASSAGSFLAAYREVFMAADTRPQARGWAIDTNLDKLPKAPQLPRKVAGRRQAKGHQSS
jgi:hypothetical protein